MFRLIARLDIKGEKLIKGIQMEGLRVIGDPAEYAVKYANEGADELLYLDTVATLYGRNQLGELLAKTTQSVFVPATVGGGLVSVGQLQSVFKAGADKIAINSGAISNPSILSEFSGRFGKQAIVASIECKRTANGWEAYTDCGREKTGKDAIAWAHEAEALGAGEILITSIDRDGTRKGVDIDLLAALDGRNTFGVPLLYGGGIGCVKDIRAAMPYCDGVVIGSWLHSGKITINQIRDELGLDRIAA